MNNHSALNTIRRWGITLAIAALAAPALADGDDSVRRVGPGLGPMAHSNQGRGGTHIEGDYQLPFITGHPTKIKRIEQLNGPDWITEPIDRIDSQSPISSGWQGVGIGGEADNITRYLGPTSYSTPVPAPGSIVVVLGAGLLAARRRR